MFSLFLDAMTVVMTGYFVILIIWLAKINIEERMSRGRTCKQALMDILRDIFYIERIGK
jgi:preprotein translocase subunit SecG